MMMMVSGSKRTGALVVRTLNRAEQFYAFKGFLEKKALPRAKRLGANPIKQHLI